MDLKKFYQEMLKSASAAGILCRAEQDSFAGLRHLSEACIQAGRELELEEQLSLAENLYILSLKIYEALGRKTKLEKDVLAAREICLSLADLNMQQGNMHGADVYYVKACSYEKAI